jgi:hypothetical protein
MSDDGAKVPKIPQDLITQVSRDNEYIDDYSGGISARREPGEGKKTILYMLLSLLCWSNIHQKYGKCQSNRT